VRKMNRRGAGRPADFYKNESIVNASPPFSEAEGTHLESSMMRTREKM
jgi:hypothetical protein